MDIITKIKDELNYTDVVVLTADKEIGEISGMVLNVIMGVGFGLSIISIAYSMILYITSAGDPNKLQTAWSAFLWGVVAGLISIAVLAFRRIILTVLGVDDESIVSGLPNF